MLAAPPPSPPPAPGAFPTEYSTTRALITNNPGSLLAGEDWQGLSTQQDLVDHTPHFHLGSTQPIVEAADKDTPNQPAGTKRASLVSDPVFVQCIQCWFTDADGAYSHEVRYGHSFTGSDFVWVRVLVKFQSGFTDGNCYAGYGGGESHKLMFMGSHRPVQTGGDKWNVFNETFGGSESLLPGSPANGQPGIIRGSDAGLYTDEEWWEIIFCYERQSATDCRNRMWVRQASIDDTLQANPDTITNSGGNASKWGYSNTGGSVPSGDAGNLKLGVNRNCYLADGASLWLKWGPYEVIDGDVIADPYGLASDML